MNTTWSRAEKTVAIGLRITSALVFLLAVDSASHGDLWGCVMNIGICMSLLGGSAMPSRFLMRVDSFADLMKPGPIVPFGIPLILEHVGTTMLLIGFLAKVLA